MSFYPLFIPLAGMISLTFLVWLYMYSQRLHYVITNKINAEDLLTPEQVNSLLPATVNASSNNLKNLFEMPVLFYVVIMVAAQIPDHSIVSNLAAWSFFFFRVVHSVVHCLNGKVMIRFFFYILSIVSLMLLTANVFYILFNLSSA